MRETNWKDIAELIGIAAIVASLVFVGMQMRQDQQIAKAQIYTESNIISIELARLINENRDVWISGMNGEELSAGDEVTFHNMFIAVRFSYGGIWQRAIRLSTRKTDTASKEFAYLLFTYPGLRRVWEKYLEFQRNRSQAYSSQGRYPISRFDINVEELLRQLDDESVQPPETKFFTPAL